MKLYINPNEKKGRIHSEIYGHFSEHLGRCIYEGIYVGEDSKIPNEKGMRKDVVKALKELHMPVLRWPGGCFADEYHWMEGIGPKNNRKKMINTHWGGVVEDNSFGTDEFMELCRQLGCKAYINGNLGSGTVQEMSEWVEYLTFNGVSPMAKMREENGHKEPYRVDYFAVGNENWGCGGNMNPEYYADLYRRYQTYIRNYNGASSIAKIACGPNSDDYEWTRKVLEGTFRRTDKKNHGFMDGLSLHYYTVTNDWTNKGSATDFTEEEYYKTISKTNYMETLVENHSKIMDEFDPEKKIGLIVDEWGCWHDCEPGTNPGFLYQQNTMRDAIVAAINLNIFNQHCERVKMANIAQMVNVLQAVILTEGEKMVLTPTYHVFDMYKKHMENELIDSYLSNDIIGVDDAYKAPALSCSASIDLNQTIQLTMSNASLSQSYPMEGVFTDTKIKTVSATILSNKMNAFNDFDSPEVVTTKEFTELTVNEGGLNFTIPPCSVLQITIQIC